MVFGIFGIPNIDVGISVFFQISRICFVFWHTDPWWYSVVCLDFKNPVWCYNYNFILEWWGTWRRAI